MNLKIKIKDCDSNHKEMGWLIDQVLISRVKMS